MNPPAVRSSSAIGIVAAVVTVLVWTAFIVVARASASQSLGPFDLAFCRMVGAGCVLLPWGAWLVQRQRARQRLARADAVALPAKAGAGSLFGLSPLSLSVTVKVGLFGGLLYALLAYSGFFYAPAVHASVLLPGSLPLWTALLAALVLRDRITPARAVGLVLILAGDLIVGGRSLALAFDGGEVWKGDLLFMGAALCWACYSVAARHHWLDAVRATIAITVFACLSYLPVFGLLTLGGWLASGLGDAPGSEILFQIVFQGMGSVVVSGISFTRMIEHFGPVRSTMITAVVPGLSALAAVFFLDEPLHPTLLLGLALVTAGIVFGGRAVQAGAVPAALPPGAPVRAKPNAPRATSPP